MTPLAKSLATFAVAGLALFVWLHFHDAQIRQEERALAGVDSLKHHRDSVFRAAALANVARADSIRIVTATITRAHRTSDALTAAYRERLADSLRAGFDSVEAAKNTIIAHQAGLIALLFRERDSRDSTITALNATLTTTLGRLEVAVKRKGLHVHCGPGIGAGVTVPLGAGLYVGAACTL